MLNGGNEIEMESLLTDVRGAVRGGQQWNIQPPYEFNSSDRRAPRQLSSRERKALEDLQFIADHHRDEREEYQVGHVCN